MDFQGYPLNCILLTSHLVTCVPPRGFLSLIKSNFFGAALESGSKCQWKFLAAVDLTIGTGLKEYAQNSQTFTKLQLNLTPRL